MGLPLLQGYGMTETSPVVSANKVVDNHPTTVGRPLKGVQVRIGELSELQVRGPGVMKGYWKRPEDTANAMTADGWLRTGDQAVIEEERIRIVGRIKEIIVTSTGEKIPPGDLELAIGADPLFDQVFVIGENRPFIAAFVVLNKGLWEALAASIGVDAATGLDSEPARAAVLEKIQATTRSFPIYAVPRGVRLTLEPWSIQNGLMTPTLKLKRKALNARFEAEIEDVYAARAR
jgi:long-chain acyl-CoA synthetase